MRTSIVRIAVVVALLAGHARAQESSGAWVSTGSYKPRQTLFTVNWEIAGPIGSFSDYINDTSLRGFSLEWRSMLQEKFSLGVSFSWNRFNQTFDQLTVQLPNNVTATGPVFKYADFFGVRAIAHYYLGSLDRPLQPYLGVGIGGTWAYSYQQIADLSQSQSNFDFIVDPEVGLFFWFAKGASTAGLNLAFRYTYTTATAGRQHDLQWLSGLVGVVFGY
jgi:hypothetical protein